MKKKIIGIIGLIMLLTICCIGCGREESKEVSSSLGEVTSSDAVKGNDEQIVKNDNIQFEDITMKKYVLKELGKKPDEEVTYKEAEQLKSLTIDRTYRNFVTSYCNCSLRAINSAHGIISMDLSDLQYFTGLETLNIYNTTDDNIIGWENIEKCTNLKELKMNYHEDGIYTELGEKPLLGFVYNLKQLKTLDCMYGNVTQSTMNKVKAIRPDLDIRVNQEYDISTELYNVIGDKLYPELSYSKTGDELVQSEDTLLIEKVRSVEDYKKIIDSASASGIKYIYITVASTSLMEIDCDDFLKFTNLETLSITEWYVNAEVRINNIKNLSQLQYLTTFCIKGSYDAEEISELKHVDTLSINSAINEVDLSTMTNLKKINIDVTDYKVKLPSSVEVLRTTNSKLAKMTPELKIMCDFGDKDTKLGYFEYCPKLKYCYWSVEGQRNVDLSVVKNVPELEYLIINYKKIVSGFEALSDLENLRVVNIKTVTPDAIAKLKDMKSKDSLSFFGFVDIYKYSAMEYQDALGITGEVNWMSIYYNVPGMIDLYKSGVTNTQIMQAENTDHRDEYGYNETFGTVK